MNCHKETVERQFSKGKSYYYCSSCKQTLERSITIDPEIVWWVGKDKEYWHESGGAFIRNPKGQFLFFERLQFPFVLTVPAGHVDSGETPLVATRRETIEEVGLNAKPADYLKIATEDIIGDSCSRGSDAHRWHAYLLKLESNKKLSVTEPEEGENPVWLTLDQALAKDLAYPVMYIIEKHKAELLA